MSPVTRNNPASAVVLTPPKECRPSHSLPIVRFVGDTNQKQPSLDTIG